MIPMRDIQRWATFQQEHEDMSRADIEAALCQPTASKSATVADLPDRRRQ